MSNRIRVSVKQVGRQWKAEIYVDNYRTHKGWFVTEAESWRWVDSVTADLAMEVK